MPGPSADDALPACDMSGFTPVTFQFGRVHCAGGLLNKSLPLETKNVGEHTFVKLDLNQSWILHATAGQGRRWTHSLSARTTLVDRLRTCVQQACDGVLEAPVTSDERDPMDDVDVSDDESPSKRSKQHDGKRLRYTKVVYKNSIVEVPFPERPPEVAKDVGDVQTIKLYIEDRKKIWLHIDHVPWALRWMYIQIQLKGVPLVDADSAGPSSPSLA